MGTESLHREAISIRPLGPRFGCQFFITWELANHWVTFFLAQRLSPTAFFGSSGVIRFGAMRSVRFEMLWALQLGSSVASVRGDVRVTQRIRTERRGSQVV